MEIDNELYIDEIKDADPFLIDEVSNHKEEIKNKVLSYNPIEVIDVPIEEKDNFEEKHQLTSNEKYWDDLFTTLNTNRGK